MPQTVHGQYVALFSSLGIPLHGLVEVLGHTIAVLIAEGEVELGLGIAFFSSLGKPFCGFGMVGAHALATEQAVAQCHLCLDVAGFGILAHAGNVGGGLGHGD